MSRQDCSHDEKCGNGHTSATTEVIVDGESKRTADYSGKEVGTSVGGPKAVVDAALAVGL